MIWGFITYNGIGTLCFVDGDINALKYIDILENNLWTVVARHFPQDNYVFQDDNTPVHRTHTVRTYMEETDIHHMEWPAQSPDLNVIENCWWKLKRDMENKLHIIYSVKDLQLVIRQLWENVSVDFIRDLYHTIPRRLTKMIRAKGCLTKY